jgi:hypothetical protein
MAARTKEYWNNKLITGYKIDSDDWVDLVDTFMSYEPTIDPSIILGTPNELTIDLNGAINGNFEPRLSVGTRSINVDFDLLLTNVSNGRYIDIVFSLSGTRIIKLPTNVKVSVPSTIGEWTAPNLTITAGTDDVIIMIAKYIKSEAIWDLSVNEVTPI